MNSLKHIELALVQLRTSMDKKDNLRRAGAFIKLASESDRPPDILCLPECFNSPYGTEYFEHYAESIQPPGETVQWLQHMAAQYKMYIVGGSIPEYSHDSRLYYNTCLVFDPNGQLVTTYRKLHLCDINIPDKLVFKESATLSAGSQLIYFDAVLPIEQKLRNVSSSATYHIRFGIGICYDIRFPEITLVASLKHSCQVMLFPGAFNMITGPKHWELLLRSRALDGQMFIVGISPARNIHATYVPYGHSMVVNPWGEVIKDAGIDEGLHYITLDLDQIDEVREAIPVRKQRRHDVYRIDTVL